MVNRSRADFLNNRHQTIVNIFFFRTIHIIIKLLNVSVSTIELPTIYSGHLYNGYLLQSLQTFKMTKDVCNIQKLKIALSGSVVSQIYSKTLVTILPSDNP